MKIQYYFGARKTDPLSTRDDYRIAETIEEIGNFQHSLFICGDGGKLLGMEKEGTLQIEKLAFKGSTCVKAFVKEFGATDREVEYVIIKGIKIEGMFKTVELLWRFLGEPSMVYVKAFPKKG